jgi:hypothetical protein
LDTREGEHGQKKAHVVEREDQSPEREKDKYRERTRKSNLRGRLVVREDKSPERERQV